MPRVEVSSAPHVCVSSGVDIARSVRRRRRHRARDADAPVAGSMHARGSCVVCFARDDDAGTSRASEFVRCANGHGLCATCFDGHVKRECEKDVRELRRRMGEVMCPMNTAALGKGERCASTCFGAREIATRCSAETFEAYDEARRRVKEAMIVEEAEERLKSERERLAKEGGGEGERLRATREHVIERIFVTACPRCTQAFVDFSGCFALLCSRCNAGICAYCIADCGRDAHAHIGNCQLAKDVAKWQKKQKDKAESFVAANRGHPMGTFGSMEMFREAERLRRIRNFATYAATWDDEFFKRVLDSLERELKDLGISPKDVIKERTATVKRNNAPPPRRGGRDNPVQGEPFPEIPAPRRGAHRRARQMWPNLDDYENELDDEDFDLGDELGRGFLAMDALERERAMFWGNLEQMQRDVRARMARQAARQAEEHNRREAVRAIERQMRDNEKLHRQITLDEELQARKSREKKQADLERAVRLSMHTAAQERARERRRGVAGASHPWKRDVNGVVSLDDEGARQRRRADKRSKSSQESDPVIDLT